MIYINIYTCESINIPKVFKQRNLARKPIQINYKITLIKVSTGDGDE